MLQPPNGWNACSVGTATIAVEERLQTIVGLIDDLTGGMDADVRALKIFGNDTR